MNAIRWFEIYVDDMQRAKTFYETVLDTTLEQVTAPAGELEMWQFPADVDAHGSGGALVRMNEMKAGGNSVLVYFACEDCSIEAGRVAAAGGQLLNEKMAIGEYGFVAHAKDSEGNMFGLHSLK